MFQVFLEKKVLSVIFWSTDEWKLSKKLFLERFLQGLVYNFWLSVLQIIIVKINIIVKLYIQIVWKSTWSWIFMAKVKVKSKTTILLYGCLFSLKFINVPNFWARVVFNADVVYYMVNFNIVELIHILSK